jgi:predicted dehydrogenase
MTVTPSTHEWRSTTMTVRIGIAGAGPWAQRFHAPTFAAGPETELTAVWSRSAEGAERLAAEHGAKAAGSFEQLLAMSDAIVFAVPPNVQCEYAPLAAEAGKALLLEKPLGLNLGQAQIIADAVHRYDAVNQVMLSNRYSDALPVFLEQAETQKPIGAVATFVNNSCLPGGMFATPWRVKLGSILDLGPHVLDVLDAALGPVENIAATGDPARFVTVVCQHEGGAVSQATLSNFVPVDPDIAYVRLFTESGELTYDFFTGTTPKPEIPGHLRAQFAQTVTSGTSPEINIDRVVYLQGLLDQAMVSATGHAA